jgi:hypothetical protein
MSAIQTTNPEAYSVRDFCRAFSVGTTKFYYEVKAGRIRAKKLGTRTIILKSDALEWAKSLPTMGARP